MPENNRKLRVFLCHSSHDKPVVRELYQRLKGEDWIDPWLDEEKLLPGQDWDIEIEKAVERADVVMVCLSKGSVTKEGYIQRELKFALDIALEKPDETIFIVPLRLDDCEVPRRLRARQFVDFFPVARRDWAYQRLLRSLKIRAGDTIQRPVTQEMPRPSVPRPDSGQGISALPSRQPAQTPAFAPSGILDLGWSILPILLYIVISLLSFGNDDSDFSFFIGVLALLTGSVLAFKRQVMAIKLVKYSTLLFIVTHSLLIYSGYSGWNLTPFLSVLNGIVSLLAGGLLLFNFKSPRIQVAYSTIFFAAFISLYGLKLILNYFNEYPNEIQTPTVVLGIIACIFIWFEQ